MMNLRKIANRALSFFGLQRRNAFSFQGAQANRLTLDWWAAILSADQEIKGNMRTLRARGRELGRNNPVAKRYLSLLAANVVGDKGVRYQSRVRSASGELNSETNRKIETAFADLGKLGNCTVDGKLSLRAVQDLVIRAIATDGEVFVRHVPGFANKYGYAFQLSQFATLLPQNVGSFEITPPPIPPGNPPSPGDCNGACLIDWFDETTRYRRNHDLLLPVSSPAPAGYSCSFISRLFRIPWS